MPGVVMSPGPRWPEDRVYPSKSVMIYFISELAGTNHAVTASLSLC
jgi:hypothetical protein